MSLLLVFIALMAGAITTGVAEEKVIVYNYDDYIPGDVLEDFTKETGIAVDYSTYNSSEILFVKLQMLQGRGYDVVVPPTDLVEKMYKEGLLQPIDKDLVENFKFLDMNLLDKPYDPKNEYSIPYLWGSTGIAANRDEVDVSQVKYWKDLWDSKWEKKLLLMDDMRGVFHMALKVNGHSTNSINEEEIRQAYELLRELMPNVLLFSADAPENNFLSKKVSLGSLWNGAAAQVKAKNDAIEYIYPGEGGFFWVDSFAIPSRAQNVDNAHTFINYMLRSDVAARCVKELQYATASLKAKELLSEAVRNNLTIFPTAKLLKRAEFQRDVGEKLAFYESYWGKLKGGE